MFIIYLLNPCMALLLCIFASFFALLMFTTTYALYNTHVNMIANWLDALNGRGSGVFVYLPTLNAFDGLSYTAEGLITPVVMATETYAASAGFSAAVAILTSMSTNLSDF